MHILIFKTNIETEDAHHEVSALLNAETSIIDWNIDREDIDKVLRIESKLNNTTDIIHRISKAGFICEELPD
jgi:hypothetical protein